MSGVAGRASLFWGRNKGAKGQKWSQGIGECWLVPVWRTIFRGALHAQRPSIADSFQNNMYTTPGQIPFSRSWAFLIILNGSYSVLWRSRELTLLILPSVMARETR